MITLFRRYGASNCTGSTHNHICTSVYMPESIGVGSIQGLHSRFRARNLFESVARG